MIVFDLNGDGKLDLSRTSAEAFALAETFVRLGSRDYEFVVDLNGDKLRLTPLSEYRGRVVLLDFCTRRI